MRFLILAAVALTAFASCKNEQPAQPSTVAPKVGDTTFVTGVLPPSIPDSSFLYLDASGFESIIQKKKKKIMILDLRSAEAYSKGHVYKAVSVPYANNPNLNTYLDKLGSTQPLAIYCENGYNSNVIGMKLRKDGHSNIYILKGGVAAWLSAEKTLTVL